MPKSISVGNKNDWRDSRVLREIQNDIEQSIDNYITSGFDSNND